MHRQMLREQMAIVDDGGEPMNVFRDPAKNESIKLPKLERYYQRGRKEDGSYQWGSITAPFATKWNIPFRDLIEDLYIQESLAGKNPPVLGNKK